MKAYIIVNISVYFFHELNNSVLHGIFFSKTYKASRVLVRVRVYRPVFAGCSRADTLHTCSIDIRVATYIVEWSRLGLFIVYL